MGIDKKKEILAESNLLNPNILTEVIVIPDLLTQGIKAKTNQQAGYIKGKHGGEPAYFAPIYSNERVLTGYKIRKQLFEI